MDADHYEIDVTPAGAVVEPNGYMVCKATLDDLYARAQREADEAKTSDDYLYASGVRDTLGWIRGTLEIPYGG